MTAILILGGARSGKSRIAEAKASLLSNNRIYIATAEAGDEEMAERIARHQKDRGEHWKTIECPVLLTQAIDEHAQSGTVTLVDCLTLWLSNLMHQQCNIDLLIQELIDILVSAPGDIVLVSNEVGMGLVPNSPLGREFRDLQGRLNQSVANAVDHVEFIAAGLPLVLKNSDR